MKEPSIPQAISIKPSLLEKIRQAAAQRGITISEFIREASLKELDRLERDQLVKLA